MARKHKETDAPAATLKDEFARQRWELFHRAIAHAKQCNEEALQDTDVHSNDVKRGGPLLSIVK